MAVIDFQVTIADADIARVQAAARATFGAALSDAEIIERLRQELVNRIATIVKSYEKNQALVAANNLEPVVGVS